MSDLLPLDDARRLVFDAVQPLQPIELPLAEAYGCVMAADATTEFDMPPFSSADTDGFAVRAADIAGASADAPVGLRVAGWAVSGRPPEATVGWGEAVRVASGAPLPAGADCVVPVGGFVIDGETVRVTRPVDTGTHVRPAGEDMRAGAVLAPAGRRLSGAELALMAAAGYGSALAYPKVRVGVLSVGDLVEPGRPTGFGQVRDTNSYALMAGVRDLGAVPYRIGIVTDAENDLREALLSNLARADAIVCSGDLTDQDHDPLATLLAGLGDVRTYRVAVHPASAIAFGIVDGRPFFSLSAHPLAAFVGFEVFVRPAILKTMGRRDVGRPEVTAVLDQEVTGPSGMTLYVPARVSHGEGTWHAVPATAPGPSRLGALADANGFVMVEPGDTAVAAGERVRVQIFRPLER